MTPRTKLVAVAIAAVCLLPICLYLSLSTGSFFGGGFCLIALGAAVMAPAVKDNNLAVTKTLPNGATTVNTDGIDLGIGPRAQFCGGRHIELYIEAPALAVGQLANASTMTYVVQHDTDPAFGTAVSLYGTVLTQTGAGGAGAVAATKRVALPTDVKRYLRVAVTNSAAADASAASVAVSLRF